MNLDVSSRDADTHLWNRRSLLKAFGTIGFGLAMARHAGAVAAQAESAPADRWRDYVNERISAPAFPGGRSGVRLHIAVEGLYRDEAGRDREQLKFGAFRKSDSVLTPMPFESTEFEDVAVFAQEMPAGPYRLRLDFPGNRSDVATLVLDGRQTELVLHRNREGVLSIRQYLPKAGRRRDPGVMKSLEKVQRRLMDRAGSVAEARAELDILEKRWTDDPVALALCAYLAGLDGRPDQVKELASRLVAEFPDLPDGHVALASAAQSDGDRGTIVTAYRKALTLGLPILLPFLESFWNGVRLYDGDLQSLERPMPFSAQLAIAAENRVPNQLWSACASRRRSIW